MLLFLPFCLFFVGFQIYNPHHRICTTVDSLGFVVRATCDVENVGQRWIWKNRDQVLHKGTEKCLGVGESENNYNFLIHESHILCSSILEKNLCR